MKKTTNELLENLEKLHNHGERVQLHGDYGAQGDKMKIITERLILRRWTEADAESLEVIRNVFCGSECYAVCKKEDNKAIGAVELKLNGYTDMTERYDECELGFWIGKPFWGRGSIPEAAAELIRRGFEEVGMNKIWCGYYDGNIKSKRTQEKLKFVFHHTYNEIPVPLLNEVRIGHTNCLTKERWQDMK